jgi:DNA-binding NtrC family response regulator
MDADAARRILIADDDDAICFCLARALRKCGFLVTVVGDGAWALEAFHAAAGAFWLLLLDVRMPLVGGIEVGKLVHRLDPKVRVILMTAHAQFSLADTHADLLIAKPFELDKLLDNVVGLLKETVPLADVLMGNLRRELS